MTVTRIGGVEVGVGEPVLEAECLAGEFKVLLSALEDYVDVCIWVALPAFAFVGPSEHAGTLLIAGTGNEVGEFLVRILRELCQVSKFVEGQLVAGLDTAEV